MQRDRLGETQGGREAHREKDTYKNKSERQIDTKQLRTRETKPNRKKEKDIKIQRQKATEKVRGTQSDRARGRQRVTGQGETNKHHNKERVKRKGRHRETIRQRQ